MPGAQYGNSPAQIDARVAELQVGIRRARAAAAAVRPAGPGGPGDQGDAAYQDAVAAVARATRALVDYEAAIPRLEERHRRAADARLARRAAVGLVLVDIVIAVAAGLGSLPLWSLVPSAVLLVAGLAVLPGARIRAAEPGFRPMVGTIAFAVAAVGNIVCVLGVVPPYVELAALFFGWGGLRSFAVLGGPMGGPLEESRRAASRPDPAAAPAATVTPTAAETVAETVAEPATEPGLERTVPLEGPPPGSWDDDVIGGPGPGPGAGYRAAPAAPAAGSPTDGAGVRR